MSINAFFHCKVSDTDRVACADRSSAVQGFVLYSNCLSILRIHSSSVLKSKQRKQFHQLSAVIRNSLVDPSDFVFFWIFDMHTTK